MRKRILMVFLWFIVAFSLIQTTAAHVPLFMQGGHSLNEAVLIDNPTKSWVIYSIIDEVAEPHYFYFEMQAGERIRLILNVPAIDGIKGFRPRLALMGNGLTNLSTPPVYLELPSGAGVMILEPTNPHPEYEGFTPTSFYRLYDQDITAPTTGRYYLAYYEPVMTGNFAVAIGYQEIFTFVEWITVPFTVLITHLWNYQSPMTLIAPVIITVILGSSLLFWRYPTLRSKNQILSWLGITAGNLFVASGIFIFYQMVLALLQVPPNPQIGITIVFGTLPIVLGLLTIRSCISTNWFHKPRQLLLLILLSILALFLWAGWIIGPILLLITAILPSIKRLTNRKAIQTP
jgi:hypothetical protein